MYVYSWHYLVHVRILLTLCSTSCLERDLKTHFGICWNSSSFKIIVFIYFFNQIKLSSLNYPKLLCKYRLTCVYFKYLTRVCMRYNKKTHVWWRHEGKLLHVGTYIQNTHIMYLISLHKHRLRWWTSPPWTGHWTPLPSPHCDPPPWRSQRYTFTPAARWEIHRNLGEVKTSPRIKARIL